MSPPAIHGATLLRVVPAFAGVAWAERSSVGAVPDSGATVLLRGLGFGKLLSFADDGSVGTTFGEFFDPLTLPPGVFGDDPVRVGVAPGAAPAPKLQPSNPPWLTVRFAAPDWLNFQAPPLLAYQ